MNFGYLCAFKYFVNCGTIFLYLNIDVIKLLCAACATIQFVLCTWMKQQNYFMEWHQQESYENKIDDIFDIYKIIENIQHEFVWVNIYKINISIGLVNFSILLYLIL